LNICGVGAGAIGGDLGARLDGAHALGARRMSLLQDLECDRSMEIGMYVGVVQVLGRLTGYPTPAVDVVLALIRQRAQTAQLARAA